MSGELNFDPILYTVFLFVDPSFFVFAQMDALATLVKHKHKNIESLLNLQITSDVAEKMLEALAKQGKRAKFSSLSHISVQVDSTHLINRHWAYRTESLTKFLAKCPALTSIHISEKSWRLIGLKLNTLFKLSRSTLKNITSLSIQMGFDECRDYSIETLTNGKAMCAVRNLRICTNETNTFSGASFLPDLLPYFPNTTFLYFAFRYLRGNTLSGTFRPKNHSTGKSISFPLKMRRQLTTLALDQCFISAGNINKLQKFDNLEKLIVFTPTKELYGRDGLSSEDPRQFRERLFRGEGSSRLKIALETRPMTRATNWTSFV